MMEDHEEGQYNWTSRNMRPVMVLYVTLVFLAFMLAAQFIFHSTDAVKALFFALIPALASMTPSLLPRTEYRLTPEGMEKRGLGGKDSRPFKEVFRWEDLSHLSSTSNGFKYYKDLEEPNPLRRFWKLHISDAYSGEFHVQGEARTAVTDRIRREGIPLARPSSPPSIPRDS